MKKLVYIVLSILIIIISCVDKNESKPTGNPSFCEDSAMAHFIAQPERSMGLLDSAVMMKRLTPQRAGYLKAIVAYSGLNKPDSCIAICQKMIDEKAWNELPDSDDRVSFQVDLYELMATAATTTSDLLGIQRYCKAGIELAHGREELMSEEANMLSRMGTAMVKMGEKEKGLEALDEAKALAQKDDKWPSVLAYMNISKKYVAVYSYLDDYESMCRFSHENLSRLKDLKRNYRKIEGIPGSMLADSTAFDEFVQYYYVSLTAHLSKAYAKRDMLDSAKVWYDELMSSPQSDNPSLSSAIIYPLIAFGNYDEALGRIESTKEFLANDTLSSDFVELLEYEQDIYIKTGRKDEALTLSQRIHALSEMANRQEYKALLVNSTAQSMLLQEQLKRKDAEEKLLYGTIAAIAVVLILLSYFGIKHIRTLRLKHTHLSNELEKAQTEIQTLKEKEPEVKAKAITPEEIFRRAQMVMERDEPFTDSSYTIDDMARQVYTNRGYLSNAINQQAGMNFRTWLAKYRVEYAKRILKESPDTPVVKLCKMCGFESRNSFYRQFCNIEGMSVTEWTRRQDGLSVNPEDSGRSAQLVQDR